MAHLFETLVIAFFSIKIFEFLLAILFFVLVFVCGLVTELQLGSSVEYFAKRFEAMSGLAIGLTCFAYLGWDLLDNLIHKKQKLNLELSLLIIFDLAIFTIVFPYWFVILAPFMWPCLLYQYTKLFITDFILKRRSL